MVAPSVDRTVDVCRCREDGIPMRVLIADDRSQVRSALRLLLTQQPDLVVVGEAVDAGQALALTEQRRPDLVLLDWDLPGRGDALSPAGLRALRPELSVVALSGRPEARRAALDAGADLFVSKGDPPERLLAAVDACRRPSSGPRS